jgi:hypothetical protein
MTITPQDTHDTQKHYVNELAKILNRPKAELWELARLLWPKIENLGESDDTTTFRVTMSPLMNILGALGCGDYNAHFHTSDGYMQTLSLVGMCSAVTSTYRPGYALARIDAPVDFKTAVPIGAAVLMTTREIGDRGPVNMFELNGKIELCGSPLFGAPRKLVMRKI